MSCVVYYYRFRLVTKLVASHDMCKTKFGCHFRVGISSEKGPVLGVEVDPKTISESGSLEKHQVRVHKMGKTGFATRKLHFSHPETTLKEMA